jgi:hypothetical protein
MIEKHVTIRGVCDALGSGSLDDARNLLQQQYPFSPVNYEKRQYNDYQKTCVFLRDGFVDRYSGEKLVFPPVLRLLSSLMPEEIPFHKNWKMSECHLAYWQLIPTIDHIVPVARGGPDDESNWVCTSQLRNSAKSNWLLEELGWQLHDPGDVEEWDGLMAWFMNYVLQNPETLDDAYIRSWYNAAKKAKNVA